MKTLLCWLLLSLSSCTGLFYYPSKELSHVPSDLGLDYEEHWIDSEGLRLHAWLLPAEAKPEAAPCVFFLHGNALNLGNHLFSVAWMPERGVNVLLFDYRGYGLSEGSTGLLGLREDAHSALDYFMSLDSCAGSKKFVLGQSLGGAMSVELLATAKQRDKISGLIIDSAFSSYRDIFREKLSEFWITWPLQLPLGYLVDDRYSPKKFAAKLPAIPKLIIHGQADLTVPYHHSQVIHQLASEPKKILTPEGIGHIAALNKREFKDLLIDFVFSAK